MRSIVCVLGLVSFLFASTAGAINIYLDFSGHSEPQANNGNQISLGAFVGSASDKAEIVKSLREDFAPFFVGFYDLAPPARPSRGWIRLVIGGDFLQLGSNGKATWECDPAAAPWCDQTPEGNNVVWVAEGSSSSARYTNRWIASTAAHELGHALGWMAAQKPHGSLATQLSHYTPSGPLAQPSHKLLPLGKTQLMGGDRPGRVRDLWWADRMVAKGLMSGGDPNDPNDWIWLYQDDLLSLSSVLPRRRIDHANTPARGTALAPSTAVLAPEQTRVEGSGVVEMNGASWPGLCPPVPRWLSCSYVDSHGNEVPPGEDPGGQHGVLAVTKDFHRFDIPSIGGSSQTQLLEVKVRTLDGSGTGTMGNLDADVEVWYNDVAASGWTEITSVGTRKDRPENMWATWVVGFSTRGWYKTGEYAVAVKSAGSYGDLGHYTVAVSGSRNVKVVPANTGGPNIGPLLRWKHEIGPSIAELAINLPDPPELAQSLAAMATHGASEENLARLIEDPYSLEASDEAMAVVKDGLGQGGAARMLAQLIDWQELDNNEQEQVWNEIQETTAHLESERYPKFESAEYEAAWAVADDGDQEVACTTHLEVW